MRLFGHWGQRSPPTFAMIDSSAVKTNRASADGTASGKSGKIVRGVGEPPRHHTIIDSTCRLVLCPTQYRCHESASLMHTPFVGDWPIRASRHDTPQQR